MTEVRTLDGNTAAGMLSEIFPFEMSLAQAICAGCGSTGPIGAQTAYTDAPGLVLRCIQCESILIRLVRGPERYWLDMRGVACLEIAESHEL